jgi:methionyl-tRNA formyltransferase
MKNKKVIVMGKGDLCIKICEWFHHDPSHTLTHIVPVRPEPTWTGSITSWAKEHRVDLIESGNYRDLSAEAVAEADIVMSVFYDKIIKKDFIDSCKKIINLHNAPLPKYRGVSPINWALKNNEQEHGVTIHEISPGIDDGRIIGQVKYSIYPEFDEVKDVLQRSVEYGYSLFKSTMPILDQITPAKQEDHLSTYYSSELNGFLKERRNFTKAESR